MELNQYLNDALSQLDTGSKPQAGPAPAGQLGPPAPIGVPPEIDTTAAAEGLTPAQRRVMASLYHQESAAGKNPRTSVDGARGPGQMMPGTFAMYAKPGESIDNPAHNLAAMARYVKDLGGKHGDDPARMFTGYFSGAGNVNPSGPQAWRRDTRDGNGKSVSSYVADNMTRLAGIGEAQAAPAPAAAPQADIPAWKAVIAGKLYQELSPAEKVQAKEAYFDHYIAPEAGGQKAELRAWFLSQKDADAPVERGDPAIMYPNQQRKVAPGTETVKLPGSAMDGMTVQAPITHATDSKVPAEPKVRAAWEADYNSADQMKRAEMEARTDWRGQIARDLSGKYDRTDALRTPTDALPEGMDGAGNATLDSLDSRVEARRRTLIAKGDDPRFAERAAVAGAEAGVLPGQEVNALGQVVEKSKSAVFNMAQDLKAAPSGEAPEGFASVTTNALLRGVKNNSAMISGLLAAGAKSVGADDLALAMLKDYFLASAQAKRYPAAVEDFTHIQSVADVPTYMWEGLLENAPQLVGTIGVGAVGVKLARMYGEKATAGLLKDVAAKELAKHQAVGGAIGAGAASIGMETGSIYGDIAKDTGQERPGVALAFGVVAGALDAIPAFRAIHKVLTPEAVKWTMREVAKRYGKEALVQLAGEGGTEFLQTWVEEAAKTAVDGRALFTKENLIASIDAFLKGGVAGVAIGGASQGLSDFSGRHDNARRLAADAAKDEALAKWRARGLTPSSTPDAEHFAAVPPRPAAPTPPAGPMPADWRRWNVPGVDAAAAPGVAPTAPTVTETAPGVAETAPNVAPPGAAPQFSDEEVLGFAANRYGQLRTKRDGQAVAEPGGEEIAINTQPAEGLTPDEAAEMEALTQARGNVPAIRQLYGLTTTQESSNGQAQAEQAGQDGAAPAPAADGAAVPAPSAPDVVNPGAAGNPAAGAGADAQQGDAAAPLTETEAEREARVEREAIHGESDAPPDAPTPDIPLPIDQKDQPNGNQAAEAVAPETQRQEEAAPDHRLTEPSITRRANPGNMGDKSFIARAFVKDSDIAVMGVGATEAAARADLSKDADSKIKARDAAPPEADGVFQAPAPPGRPKAARLWKARVDGVVQGTSWLSKAEADAAYAKLTAKAPASDDLGAMFDDVLAEEIAARKKKPKTEKQAKAARAAEPPMTQLPSAIYVGASGVVHDEEALQRRNLGENKAPNPELLGAEVSNMFAAAALRDAKASFDASGKFVGAHKYRVAITRGKGGVYMFNDLAEAKNFADTHGRRKPKTEAQAAAARTAGAAATSAAKNAAAGLNAAIDGLGALFGGKGRVGSGLQFDEETYAKAKPLFDAAVSHLKSAASDAREAMRAIVKMVLDRFGPEAATNMKPYVLRYMDDTKAAAAPLPAILRFASGLSRTGDLTNGSQPAGGAQLQGIGVALDELYKPAIDQLAHAIVVLHARVFVDSGAYAAKQRKQKSGDAVPVDFDAVLAKYDAISEAIHKVYEAESEPQDYPRPYYVMPDIMGDQRGTIDLIKQHAKWISTEAKFYTSRPIVPIPAGELTMAEAYREIVAALGTDEFIVGVPVKSNTVTPAELTAFLQEAKPASIHLLGVASDKLLAPWQQAVRDSGQEGTVKVTADASPIRHRVLTDVKNGATRAEALANFLFDPNDPAHQEPAGPDNTLVLMACGETKNKEPGEHPLHELYTGPFWQSLNTNRGAIPHGNVWALSGKLGLVPSETRAATYNEQITAAKVDALLADVGARAADIAAGIGKPIARVIAVGSGEYARYFDALLSALKERGALSPTAEVTRPAGRIGEQRQQMNAALAAVNGVEPAAPKTEKEAKAARDAAAATAQNEAGGTGDEQGTGGEGASALAGVPAAEGRGAGEGTPAADGGERSGDASGNGNPSADAGRRKKGRSRGNGAAATDSAAAGTGGSGGLAGEGAGRAGSEVSGADGAAGSGGLTPAAIPATNFTITGDVDLGSGGKITKYRDNVAAIKVLKALEADRRRATPAEQITLARYVGWGGIPNAFRNAVSGKVATDWDAQVSELESLLTPQELRAAAASTRNAHYTSLDVVTFMWGAALKLGYTGGSVLESSVGSGNFIGLMPGEVSGRSFVTGIELDSLTSRIAAALYPRSNIINTGFQKAALPTGHFDLAIGNPPFGSESLRFQYKPHLNGASIHNQFFLGALDAVAPEGLMVQVVSRYLMDAQDASTREKLAIGAELLGAIRLPGSAFKGNALTEVVTDILFFKKRTASEAAALQEAYDARGKPPKGNDYQKNRAYRQQQDELASALTWTTTTKVDDPLGGEPMIVSRYFRDNPANIVGTMQRSGSMRQEGDIDVTLAKGESLQDRLTALLAKMREHPRMTITDEALANTEKMHEALGESLRLIAKGAEADSIFFNEDGALTTVVERIGTNGSTTLTTVPVTAGTPWSPNVMMGLDGLWFREVTTTGPDGKNVKVGGRIVRTREVFKTAADVPATMLLGPTRFAKINALIGMRDLLVKQIDLEVNRAPVAQMEGNRAQLRAAYEAFVAQHGFIGEAKNAGIISDMPDEGLLMSLETGYKQEVTAAKAKRTGMKPSPASAKQAPILTRPVALPAIAADSADNAADALAITLSETGRIDLARVAALRGITEDAAKAELTSGDTPLAYIDPEAGNTLADKNAYLSGNVRRKLEAARAAGLDANVAALQAVQPALWGSDKVTAKLGANWIPVNVYGEFLTHLLGEEGAVSYAKLTNVFEAHGNDRIATATAKWGTQRYPLTRLLTATMNSSKVAVYDTDSDGNRELNQVETDAAVEKRRELYEEFDNWIFKDADRRAALTKTFNDLFNVRVRTQYDGSHMTFPGKVPDSIISMRRGQINAVWRGIVDNSVLYDHAVGAGKTFTGIARAMERRRMGLSKKPMVVVPNHLVAEWAAQAYRLYPGARILSAGKKDMEAKNRRRLFAKIASGDWDLVIVPHSSFAFIPISQEAEERILQEEMAVAAAALKEAEEESDPNSRFKSLSVKEAEALIAKLEGRLDKVRAAGGKDKLLTFEQLGIDDLTVDEAHEFKNLFYSSKLTDVRGMGNKQGSNKAYDLFSKTRVIRDAGGSLAFMTGTPVSNSAVELYNILRYLQPGLLKEHGLEHFDAFRAQYVDATAKFEPTDSGSGLKLVTRLGRSWSNMRALLESYYSIADVVTNDDIKRWFAEDNPGKEFPLPKVKSGDRIPVAVQPTPTQLEQLNAVIAGFNGLSGISDIKARNAERLRLMDRARKVALHAKAVDPNLTDEPGGKLDVAVGKVAELYAKWQADKGAQLIFLDRGVPKAKGDSKIIAEYDALKAEMEQAARDGDDERHRKLSDKFDAYDSNEIAELRAAQTSNWSAYQHIKDGLIAKGIPATEIAFVQNFNSDAEKAQLFQAVRDGEIRVLIGSSQRMGAGMNVQERLVALHHIDATWKPSDIEQREGRIIRQSNSLLEKYGDKFQVEIYAYVTERTVDAKLWDLNATKLRMINAIRYYDGAFEMDFDDEASVGMAEIAALASGDPLLLDRFKLSTEIDNLWRARRSHRRSVEAAEDSLRTAQRTIENTPKEIAENAEDIALKDGMVRAVRADTAKRSLTINGKKFDFDHVDAARMELQKIIGAVGDDEKLSVEIGGKTYTSKGAAADAVMTGLGDVEPFVAEWDGVKFIRRSDYARAIRAKLGDTVEYRVAVDPIPVGTVGGIPVSVWVSNGYGGTAIQLGLVGVNYEATGRKHVAGGWHAIEPEKHKDGTPIPLTVTGIRPAIIGFESQVERVFLQERELNRRMAEAQNDIPSLQEQIALPFKKEAELAEKEARLQEVEAELASRADRNGSAAAAEAEAAPMPEGEGTSEWEAEGGSYNDITRFPVPEPVRANALQRLKSLETRADAGALTDAEYRYGIKQVIRGLEQRNDTQAARMDAAGRRRGADWIIAQLRRGVADNTIPRTETEFAEWLLDQNPALADDLGISVSGASGSGSAANYNPLARVMKLFSASLGNGSVVHEILHHTERMMPGDVQRSIVKAWERAWDAAMEKASPAQRRALVDMMMARLGNTKSKQRMNDAFQNGTLVYGDHYQLFSPSEYWAVNGTRILSARHAAQDTWVKRAASWLREFVQRVRGLLGLPSDAPILKALDAVLAVDGSRQSPTMLAERGREAGDLAQATAPEEYNNIVTNALAGAMQHFAGRKNLNTFNLYDRTLSTQYNKALKDPRHYGKVFRLVDKMANVTSLAAIRPAELSPSVLPRVDNIKSAAYTVAMGRKDGDAMKQAAEAIFAGTLHGVNVMAGKVYGDSELRTLFNMGDKGIALYRQTRAAIDASLDELAAGEAWSLAQGFVPKSFLQQVIDNPRGAENLLIPAIDQQIAMLHQTIAAASNSALAGLNASLAEYISAKTAIGNVFNTAGNLKLAGYAPLMRFGKYAVTVYETDPATGNIARDANGDVITLFFGKYETQGEAGAMVDKLTHRYAAVPDTVRITSGRDNDIKHQLYSGIDPETLELFGQAVGAKDVTRKYYQMALSDRSALKHKLQRKGVEGYNEDLPRVLSSFITSNGRFAAQRYFMRDVTNAVKYIPKEKGDVQKEAQKLVSFIVDAEDHGSVVSSLAFGYFLGGSISSAVVNMTQPLMQTLPYLMQFAPGYAATALTKAMPAAFGARQITDLALRDAMKRASREGIVEAQEIFHLYSVGSQGVANTLASALSRIPKAGDFVKRNMESTRARTGAFMTLWGSMFSVAETANRRLTFIAAWDVATQTGVKDKYAFAARAVNETQGIYAKHNRPNFGRSEFGRYMMIFRQFGISYLEQMNRMARRGGPNGKLAALAMVAILILMSGEEGLPFEKAVTDMIDTAGQIAGYDTNLRRDKRAWAYNHLGKLWGDLALYGVSSMLPLDFAGRLSLGNIIPGTAAFKPSDRDQALSNVLEVAGPTVGMGKQLGTAVSELLAGNFGDAAKAGAPKAIRDAATGLEWGAKGHSTDSRGNMVVPITKAEAAIKAIGFNPTVQANANRRGAPVQQDINLVRNEKQDITDKWVAGILDADPEKVAAAVQQRDRWNQKNPHSIIVIEPASIRALVQRRNMDKDSRLLKSAPRSMRGGLGLDLAR